LEPSVETALYFPYIRVPQTSWFTQILLYWDAGAAIVPQSMHHDDAALGPYMAELVRERLVTLVRPDGELWMHQEAFKRRFVELLDTHRPIEAAGRRKWTQVHTDKLGWSLFREMADRGLARKHEGPEWESWWDVEESIADLYMAYLAGAICGVRKEAFPVTDSSRAVARLGPASGDTMSRLRELRYAAVMNALPAPSAPVPARELVSFKQDHQERLSRLRVHLDGRLADIAAVDDEDLRLVKTKSALQEIRDEVAVLQERMAKRAWPQIVLVGVGGVVGSALALASTVATGGGALALGLAVGSGVLSLGTASYQAAELVGSPRFDRHAPLVYAALTAAL
jgi:Family of unknown function (DUF6236)